MVIKNYEITEWPALKWVLDCWKFYGDIVRLLIFYRLSFIYASRAFSRSLHHFGPPNDLRLGSFLDWLIVESTKLASSAGQAFFLLEEV